jgi:hypothetical protein
MLYRWREQALAGLSGLFSDQAAQEQAALNFVFLFKQVWVSLFLDSTLEPLHAVRLILVWSSGAKNWTDPLLYENSRRSGLSITVVLANLRTED